MKSGGPIPARRFLGVSPENGYRPQGGSVVDKRFWPCFAKEKILSCFSCVVRTNGKIPCEVRAEL